MEIARASSGRESEIFIIRENKKKEKREERRREKKFYCAAKQVLVERAIKCNIFIIRLAAKLTANGNRNETTRLPPAKSEQRKK